MRLCRGKLKSAPSEPVLNLAESDDYRVSDEQKCDHQGAVAPSRYHFNHDSYSTSFAPELYISRPQKGMPHVSKQRKNTHFSGRYVLNDGLC